MTEAEAADVLTDSVLKLFQSKAGGAEPSINRARTLSLVAERLGCDVFRFERGAAGIGKTSYAPGPEENGANGIALVEADTAEPIFVRHLAHELAHHVLFWFPVLSGNDMSGTERHALKMMHLIDGIEEAVCRAVADAVRALPLGVQENGKVAVPGGPARLRRFHVKPALPSMNMPRREVEALDAMARREVATAEQRQRRNGSVAPIGPFPDPRRDPARSRELYWWRELLERRRFSEF